MHTDEAGRGFGCSGGMRANRSQFGKCEIQKCSTDARFFVFVVVLCVCVGHAPRGPPNELGPREHRAHTTKVFERALHFVIQHARSRARF